MTSFPDLTTRLYGILEADGTVRRPKSSLETLENLSDASSRAILRTRIDHREGEILVSTVFLGIDHGFAPMSSPIWFETLTTGPRSNDGITLRYETIDKAVIGHERLVQGFLRRKNARVIEAWKCALLIAREDKRP